MKDIQINDRSTNRGRVGYENYRQTERGLCSYRVINDIQLIPLFVLVSVLMSNPKETDSDGSNNNIIPVQPPDSGNDHAAS